MLRHHPESLLTEDQAPEKKARRARRVCRDGPLDRPEADPDGTDVCGGACHGLSVCMPNTNIADAPSWALRWLQITNTHRPLSEIALTDFLCRPHYDLKAMPKYLALCLLRLPLLTDAYFLNGRNIQMAARMVTVASSVVRTEQRRYLPGFD